MAADDSKQSNAVTPQESDIATENAIATNQSSIAVKEAYGAQAEGLRLEKEIDMKVELQENNKNAKGNDVQDIGLRILQAINNQNTDLVKQLLTQIRFTVDGFIDAKVNINGNGNGNGNGISNQFRIVKELFSLNDTSIHLQLVNMLNICIRGNNNNNNNINNNNNTADVNLDRMSKHCGGSMVIQLIIEIANRLNIENSVKYIIVYVLENLRLLSCQRYGCRIVQSMILNQFNINVNIRIRFQEIIYDNIPYLINDPFGKYVIQSCISHSCNFIQQVFIENIFFNINLMVDSKCYINSNNPQALILPSTLKSVFERYCEIINENSIINFSKYAFGRHSGVVCQTAFKYASLSQKYRLIMYLTNPHICIKYNILLGMVNHQYGHFVIENIFKTTMHVIANQQAASVNTPAAAAVETEIAKKLIDYIEKMEKVMRQNRDAKDMHLVYPYSRHVTRMAKRIANNITNNQPNNQPNKPQVWAS